MSPTPEPRDVCAISDKEIARALRSWRGQRWFVAESRDACLWMAQRRCKALSGYPASAFEQALACVGIVPKVLDGFWEITICDHKETAQ